MCDLEEFAAYLKKRISPSTGKIFSAKMISDTVSRIRRLEILFNDPISKWGIVESQNKDDLRLIKKRIKSLVYNDEVHTKKHIAYGRAITLFNEFKQQSPRR
jgi:hypothetical protein